MVSLSLLRPLGMYVFCVSSKQYLDSYFENRIHILDLTVLVWLARKVRSFGKVFPMLILAR